MAKIEVVYDPQLEFEPIEEPMIATTVDENGEYNQKGIQQTKVTGIISPLIKVNNVVISFTAVRFFYMDCSGMVPTIKLEVDDYADLIKSLDRPKNDNLLRVQILPPFDNVYKKINMNFYITGLKIVGNRVYIDGVYKMEELYRSRLEGFGKKTTWEMVDRVAKDCKLGLASNIKNTVDSRWLYCKNESYKNLLERAVGESGGEREFPDVWIDWFNYLNVVDIYERYNSVEKDLKVWTINKIENEIDDVGETKAMSMDAILSNAPNIQTTPLGIDGYELVNAANNNLLRGTDQVVEGFKYELGEPESILIQDGDIHEDVFTRKNYYGEVFGDWDYFLQRNCRNMFFQKMRGSCIRVRLKQPCMGLMRGEKVNLYWYDINEIVTTSRDNDSIVSNIPLKELPTDIPDGRQPEHYAINKQVSGQYLILESSIKYERGKWSHILLLSRPTDLTKSYTDAIKQ